MKIVQVRSDDYKQGEHQMTLIVNHYNKSRSFKKWWDKAVGKAKKDAPESWTLDEVFEILDKAGWQVIRVDDAEEVQY